MITELLSLQNQIRIFHWQTDSYAQHMAFDRTYEALDDHIDKFVEVFSGKYGRVETDGGFTIKLENIGSNEMVLEFVDKNIDYLTVDLPKMLNIQNDVDLLNIVADLIGALNQLKYLLTLN